MPFIALALVAAAAGSPGHAVPATLRNPTDVVRTADLPNELLAQRSFAAAVGVRVVVDEKGKAADCAVVQSSQIKSLDNLTCALFMARARFQPAMNASGAPQSGVFEMIARWVNGSDAKAYYRADASLPATTRVADLEVSVAKLPAGVASPAQVGVVLDVASQGDIAQCWPDASAPASLGPLACRQIASLAPLPKVMPGKGNAAAPSIRAMTVNFVTASR